MWGAGKVGETAPRIGTWSGVLAVPVLSPVGTPSPPNCPLLCTAYKPEGQIGSTGERGGKGHPRIWRENYRGGGWGTKLSFQVALLVPSVPARPSLASWVTPGCHLPSQISFSVVNSGQSPLIGLCG